MGVMSNGRQLLLKVLVKLMFNMADCPDILRWLVS